MKINLIFLETEQGFHAQIDRLPLFQLTATTKLEILKALPTALRKFSQNWHQLNHYQSETYGREIATIQRLQARGYYQSTLHRMETYLKRNNPDEIDLELIHCSTNEDFQRLLCVLS